MGVVPVVGMLAARDYIQHDRVVARLSDGERPSRCAPSMSKRRAAACDRQRRFGVARRAARPGLVGVQRHGGDPGDGVIIAGANRFGASEAHVQEAVQQIERAGDASGFLSAASTATAGGGGRIFSLLNSYRGLGAMHLSATERLALEMAVHEENERRAHGRRARDARGRVAGRRGDRRDLGYTSSRRRKLYE